MTATSLMDSTLAAPAVLVAQQLAATETTQYTASSAHWVKIASARLTNTSAASVTVSVSVVKTGGSAGSSNRVLSSYALAAGDGIGLDELKDTFLGPGDFISAIASTGAAVAFVMTGVVFS